MTPAIVVDQKPLGAGTRSTVGTAVDVAPLLRLLFSRCGTPSAGGSMAYSFNHPAGMCPECTGLGTQMVLDEPSTGLHSRDVEVLAALLERLVNDGNTVIAIEHRLELVARADWIIDLGPEGGSAGGEVVFAGTPADLLECEKSKTGAYLRATLM